MAMYEGGEGKAVKETGATAKGAVLMKREVDHSRQLASVYWI